jgi:hypothetical protein
MRTRVYIARTLFIVFILALGLIPLNIALAEGPTIVSVSAPTGLNPDEQFTVDITVEPGTAIAGVQFNLAFDPAVVTVDSVAEGNLLSQDGASTYFSEGTINNSTGTISGVAGAITTPGQSVATPETFAVITMTAGSQGGTSALTLSGVVVGDVNGQAVEISVVSSQVAINRAPVLGQIGNRSSNEGSLLTFTISASDADNDQLLYSASSLPDGATFNTYFRRFTWTPRYDQAGVYPVHFEVTDGDLTDYEDIDITIVQIHPDWDVNGDGDANVLDMILVGQRWDESGLTGWILEDINEDGTINVLDLIIIGQNWTG